MNELQQLKEATKALLLFSESISDYLEILKDRMNKESMYTKENEQTAYVRCVMHKERVRNILNETTEYTHGNSI